MLRVHDSGKRLETGSSIFYVEQPDGSLVDVVMVRVDTYRAILDLLRIHSDAEVKPATYEVRNDCYG